MFITIKRCDFAISDRRIACSTASAQWRSLLKGRHVGIHSRTLPSVGARFPHRRQRASAGHRTAHTRAIIRPSRLVRVQRRDRHHDRRCVREWQYRDVARCLLVGRGILRLRRQFRRHSPRLGRNPGVCVAGRHDDGLYARSLGEAHRRQRLQPHHRAQRLRQSAADARARRRPGNHRHARGQFVPSRCAGRRPNQHLESRRCHVRRQRARALHQRESGREHQCDRVAAFDGTPLLDRPALVGRICRRAR